MTTPCTNLAAEAQFCPGAQPRCTAQKQCLLSYQHGCLSGAVHTALTLPHSIDLSEGLFPTIE